MRPFAFPPSFTAAIAAVCLVLTLGASAPASSDDGARAFAQSLIDQGLVILRDPQADQATKIRRFEDFIGAHMDARKTALFTLGSYRRSAPENVVDPFVAAFSDYATAIYGARLIDYSEASLRVTGDVVNKPGDVTVTTLAEGGDLAEPLPIAFRLLGGGGAYKIVDVQVAGIWLSVEQRDQFAAVLSHNNGDIAALTASLKDRSQRLRASR